MKYRVATWMVLVGCLLAPALYGVETAFWQVGNFAEMLKGTLDGVALSTQGSLQISPLTETVFNPQEALALSLTADAKHNLYIGTGHQGKVFRVDAAMKGSLFFTAPEPDVFALAVGPDGALYVGTSPEGKIYRVAPDGKSRVFFDPKTKYIWALAFDRQGNLYAGTGDQGQIFKIAPDGTGKVFFDSAQTHIMCLTFDAHGNLLAGSVPNGLVYRISPQGKGFVLYQANLPEIHDLVVDSEGRIYAAALGGGPTSGMPMIISPTLLGAHVSTPIATVTVTAASENKEPEEPKGQQKPPTAPKKEKKSQTSHPSFNRPAALASAFKPSPYQLGKGSLIRILPNSTVETLWSSNRESIFGLALDGPDVLFTTDEDGRIFRLNPRQEGDNLTLLAETHESLATRLLRVGSDLYVATGNVAKLIRLASDNGHRGTYESPVKDAGFISHWGTISWRARVPAGTRLEFYTRAGNADRPDKTWSDWAGPYTDESGSAIQSPAARYLQWKAIFTSSRPHASPTLDDVTVAYLNQNLAPEIHSFNVSTGEQTSGPTPASPSVSTSPSVGATVTVTSTPGPAGSSAAAGASSTQAPPTVLSWQASDPNGDQLVYALYVKATDEKDWHLLKDDLHESNYTLAAGTLPDGKYLARLVASDAEANPPDLARKSQLVSAPFWIDDTPPQVQVLGRKVSGHTAEVRFQAQDATSPLQAAEVSTDGKPWQDVLSDDGIVDSQTETFTIRVEHLKPGEHIITLRAYDTAGNAGLGKAVLEIPPR